MRFEWDPAKEAANRRKHGLSFGDVTGLFTSGADYLELPDTAHDGEEDRLIAIGPVARGVVLVVFSERHEASIRIISARRATRTEIALYRQHLEGQP
jgi:uncharacterized DUF497 family protein